jgi:flagellar hook-associated protein 2
MKVWGILALTLMAGLQLSGLASGFDWKSLVDQLMDLERAPISRLQSEQRTNTLRNNALGDLGTRLTTLNNAAAGLRDAGLFTGRTATSSASTGAWSASATAGTATGSYKVEVTQLASAARRLGATGIAQPLNSSADVSSLTLANLRTGAAPTAGTFTVNGQRVTVALSDSLQDVFDAIGTATGGDVTGTYDPVADRITLTSASQAEITLGAANDTSNLLRVLKLVQNGTDSVTSSGTLGTLKTTAKLSEAGLATAVTAVDGNGAGTFSINGVEIAYNVNSDTLTGLIKRINESSAGVTASYDSVAGRLSLTNNSTGDIGLGVSESAGGLLGALGLVAGATAERGKDARFRVNDGITLTSASNILSETAHGISGLSVTASSESTQTITIAADTAGMRSKVTAFINAYNAVQTFIDDKTRVTSTDGKVTAAVLSANREVQDWARELRGLAFNTLGGITGSLKRLDDLGIGFTGTSGTLAINNDAKFTAALRDKSGDVEAFFQTPTNGFAAKFTKLLDQLGTATSGQQTRLGKANSDLDRQIGDLERRLVQQRELLTSSFIKMEEAQAMIQQQGTAITNAFFQNNKK